MLAVGRITKLFGAEGEVNVNLYADFPDDYSLEQPLFTIVDSLVVPLFVTRLPVVARVALLSVLPTLTPSSVPS